MNAELDTRARRAAAALRLSADAVDPVAGLHGLRRAERRRSRAQVAVAFALLVALVVAGVLARRWDPPAVGPLPSLATIPVGGQPSEMAVGGGALWVASKGAGTISRIDPGADRVVATVPVADAADVVAVGRDAVWVGGWSPDQGSIVSRVDPRTNRVVANIKTDGRPVQVAADDRSVWVTYPQDTLVRRIDPRTNKVVASLRVAQPQDLALGFGSVWVASKRGGEVVRVDPRTDPRTVSDAGRIKVDGEPTFLAVGTDMVWVGTSNQTIQRIDPGTGTVTATLEVGAPLHGIAVEGRSLWIVDPIGNAVSRTRLPARGRP